jgi:hypothetical protein
VRPKEGFIPEQLFVNVTFDPARGYVAVHPEMPPVVALSLDGIRRKIETCFCPTMRA